MDKSFLDYLVLEYIDTQNPEDLLIFRTELDRLVTEETISDLQHDYNSLHIMSRVGKYGVLFPKDLLFLYDKTICCNPGVLYKNPKLKDYYERLKNGSQVQDNKR